METGYQRSRIQEESLHYERLKHEGTYPIVGVNTFLDPGRTANVLEASALTRSTKEEKDARLAHVRDFQQRHASVPDHVGAGLAPARETTHAGGGRPQGSPLHLIGDSGVGAGLAPARAAAAAPWQVPSAEALARMQATARAGGNVFAELLEAVCSCSLGQISHALYEVGGQYRRSM